MELARNGQDKEASDGGTRISKGPNIFERSEKLMQSSRSTITVEKEEAIVTHFVVLTGLGCKLTGLAITDVAKSF